MAITGVTFSNQRVSAADHAALFQLLMSDGVISGCGVNTLRNTLTISSGSFILAGRMIKIEGSEVITIPETMISVNARLTGVIDLAQAAEVGNFGQFKFRLDVQSGGAYPELRKENINTGNGQYYEVEWGTLVIDSQSNISSYSGTIGQSEGGGQGGSNFISESDITFDGASISGSSTVLYSSSGTDWEIIILEAANKVLEFAKRPGAVDICLVAAGCEGNYGNNASNPRKGGNGGEVVNSSTFTLDQGGYAVTVGVGDSGMVHDTSIYNAGGSEALLIARQLNGENNGGNDTTANGGDGVFAFGDDEVLNQTYKTRKYGAGGGRGGVFEKNSQSGVWSESVASGSGGTTGGGDGQGTGDTPPIHPGAANTGSGGGGGRQATAGGNVYYGNGALGGSGIIIIRNHRTTPAA